MLPGSGAATVSVQWLENQLVKPQLVRVSSDSAAACAAWKLDGDEDVEEPLAVVSSPGAACKLLSQAPVHFSSCFPHEGD